MEQIFYSYYQYKDWNLLLGATNKGLCYIGFDETTIDNLIQSCKKQFGQCTFVKNKDPLSPFIKELNVYFDGELTSFSVPLDFHGTNFQMNVWKALLTIGYGETVSYSHIAALINNPKALRAVGTAIGQNPIPIIIPCHRVIAKNGSLGGYSGGLHIKERLLAIENIHIPKN